MMAALISWIWEKDWDLSCISKLAQLMLRVETLFTLCVWAVVIESISDSSLAMVVSLLSRTVISLLIIPLLALSLLARASLDGSLGGVVNLPLTHGVSVTAGDCPLDLKTEAGINAAVKAGEIAGGHSSVLHRVVVVIEAVPRAGLETAGQLKHETILAEFVVNVVVTIVGIKDRDGDDLGTTEVETGLDTAADVETGFGTNLKQPKGLIMFPSSSVAAILFGTVLCQLTLFLEHKTEFKFLDKSLTDFQGICWKYL